MLSGKRSGSLAQEFEFEKLKGELKDKPDQFAVKCNGAWIVPRVMQSRRRKTVSFEIKHGELVIRMPVGTPEQWVLQLMQQRRVWIEEHMVAQLTRQKRYQINPYETRCAPLQGRDIPLLIRQSTNRSSVVLCEEAFEINLSGRIRRSPESVTNALLQAWLAEKAKEYLIPRTLALSSIVGLRPDKVSIGNYKTMWGRCSAKGDIALNWRLMMAAPDAIDYVIIHELCHLREFNHSAAFWREVALYCPEMSKWRYYFKERSVWLQWR